MADFFDAIDRAILEIEMQARGLDEVTRSAETIKSGSERILKRAEIMRKAFGPRASTARLGSFTTSVRARR